MTGMIAKSLRGLLRKTVELLFNFIMGQDLLVSAAFSGEPGQKERNCDPGWAGLLGSSTLSVEKG